MFKLQSLLFAFLLIAFAGCNSHPDTAKVSGIVTLDGKPLEFGSVMFQNRAGGQPAMGDISADGTFTLSTFSDGDGALLGNHQIRVVCYSNQSPDSKNSSGDSLGQLLIPERYTSLGASGLTAEVTPDGLSNYVVELSSKRQ